MELNSKLPAGPIEQAWDRRRFEMKLVNPSNKRKHTIIMVGSGLAGASAAASLAELGYNVLCFCYHDSPRRAHSIAAQGGINAAKNYRNDGDSVYRLFYDTVKGGDFRSREANVYRLAQLSVDIIDQCVAQGVPFAREYSGLLDNRSFGGAQVSRTFYARGQTGQQLLLGAYQALERQIDAGKITMYPRTEMLDLVVVDGPARGIVTRNLVSGEINSFVADAVVLATGSYGNVFYLSTNAKNSNATAIWRAYKRGAAFANPCFTQIHPTCIPVSGHYQSKLTLMSESLRNDGRIWVPKQKKDPRSPNQIPVSERDYYLERRYPSFGNLVPRDVASRAAKEICDDGRGVGEHGLSVYLDFKEAIGLADGYFIIPYTVSDYLATTKLDQLSTEDHSFQQIEAEIATRVKHLLGINGKRTVDSIHQELGKLMWDHCGLVRNERGLRTALTKIPEIRDEFWHNLRILGSDDQLNQSLEKAGRVADFLELAELMCLDALERKESCGCHFREEFQTPDGEAQRDDRHFCNVFAWEYAGNQNESLLHKESCGMMINGMAHGPRRATAACQLHMRHFKDGDIIHVEPWRSRAFPVLKDLVVDRSAFDRIIQAGGYVSVSTGSAPEANTIPIPKQAADLAMDAAACIGCGACVASCPNGSASLFTSAKVSQLALLPQGQPEREQRVMKTVEAMDREGFGNCTMHRECEAVCPKSISVNFIARMNREYLRSILR